MRIKKVQLKNGYKRFRDLTIYLGESPSKIVALVGPNGSGKSSVFDGMLYRQAASARVGEGDSGDWRYHSMDGNPIFDDKRRENVQIDFDAGIFDVVIDERLKKGTVGTLFSFRSPYRYSETLNVPNLSKLKDIRSNDVGAAATFSIDKKITDNYQRIYTLLDRALKKPKSTHTYETAKQEVIGKLNESLQKVLGFTISDHGDILGGRGTFFFKKPDQEKEFSFNVLSSGEKEVIDILVDIFVKKDEYAESIYLIDEPELHINTGIQRKLLNEIVSMIPATSQIWIATHSVGFLNSLKQDHPNDASVIWFEGNFGSENIVLRPMEKTRANWKKVFTTALEDLTGLLAPKTIIYCEGRREPSRFGSEQGLDAKVYNEIFNPEFPDTLFISSGGSTQPEIHSEIGLKVLGKAFDDVELKLLKDKDIHGDGSATKSEDREAWLKEAPKSRRMLERRELENYLFDFEVIKRIQPGITKEEYCGIVTDIIEQDVKGLCSTIKKVCGREQIGPDEFKCELAKHVTPKTAVYQELREAIFVEFVQPVGSASIQKS